MMKKKYRILLPIAVVVLLLAVLFLPIPRAAYDDGGTREYRALTYRIVDWNRLSMDGVYAKTRFYGFADRNTPIDELWAREEAQISRCMIAKVIHLAEGSVTVESVEDGRRYLFDPSGLEDIGAVEGSVVELRYGGALLYTDPPTIAAVQSWKLSKDLRQLPYTGLWLDKTTAQAWEANLFADIIITEIYADCFFAEPVIPMPNRIKLNGVLSEEWCVGDQVICTYENTYYDEKTHRIEADLLTVQASDWAPEPGMAYKPVIYLYPETEAAVTVELALDGALTCTYPAYGDGWQVTAAPDGTLTDGEGQTYNYLYWEGELAAQYDLTEGFCVRGEDTAAFLEEALAALGLTRREANEFIVYWLPLMQDNPYNLIAFQTERYTDAARLTIDPAPDTLIRVFMTWRASDAYVKCAGQDLTAPAREGFVAVEWGGTELK